MKRSLFLMNGSSKNQSAVSYKPATMNIQSGIIDPSPSLTHSFINVDWENPFDQTHFTIISSSASASVSPVAADLIGKSRTICNSRGISPRAQTIPNRGPENASRFNSALNFPVLNSGIQHPGVNGGMPISGISMNFHRGLTQFPSAGSATFVDSTTTNNCFGDRGGLHGVGFQESEMYCGGNPPVTSNSISLQVDASRDVLVSANLPKTATGFDVDCTARNGVEDRQFKRLMISSTPESDEELPRRKAISSEQVEIPELGFKDQIESGGRKRKSVQMGKADTLASAKCKEEEKFVEADEPNLKRSRRAEAGCNAKDETGVQEVEKIGVSVGGDGNHKQANDLQKPLEFPKQDYIHVRARRGQATDSHSLAERVRREKISERMKFLQDLVPGCNKVIGKAVMLDEIINYVQSLQRQVEFLSMKLATVNPRLDINVDEIFQKDVLRSSGSSQIVPLLDSSSPGSMFVPFGSHPRPNGLHGSLFTASEMQCSVNPLDSTLSRSLNMQFPLNDELCNGSSQLATIWDDELPTVVHMAFGQNQDTAFHGR